MSDKYSVNRNWSKAKEGVRTVFDSFFDPDSKASEQCAKIIEACLGCFHINGSVCRMYRCPKNVKRPCMLRKEHYVEASVNG